MPFTAVNGSIQKETDTEKSSYYSRMSFEDSSMCTTVVKILYRLPTYLVTISKALV